MRGWPRRRDCSAEQLGFAPKTKAKKWEAMAEEFWRFILFSEFAFDLPGGLPESLTGIPHAKPGAEPLVYRVGDTLRQEKRIISLLYCTGRPGERRSCALEERMRDVPDLGKRDTFAFEERSFLRQYVKALSAGNWADAAEIADQRNGNRSGSSTRSAACFGRSRSAARELLVAAGDLERDLAAVAKSADALISFYTGRAYRLDQTHRELEKAVADTCGETDGVEELVDSVRKRFRAVAEQIYSGDSWIVLSKRAGRRGGRLRATQIFDKCIGPLLDTRGKRVALFFVDALRFELAVALERQLSGYTCRLHAVCAQLPTITAVGMASLLPKGGWKSGFDKGSATNWCRHFLENRSAPPQSVSHTLRNFMEIARCMLDLGRFDRAQACGKKKKPEPLAGIDLAAGQNDRHEPDEQGEMDASKPLPLPAARAWPN